MKLLNKEEFLKYKKSDTLVIWGSGSSIKKLTINDFNYLNQFDSIGFNSSIELNISPTYYIVGEILFNYYRLSNFDKKKYVGNTPNEYINKLKTKPNSCFIIWNDNKTLNKNHINQLNNLPNNYILVNQYGHDPSLHNSRLKFNNKFIDKKLYTSETFLDKKILLHQYKGINAPIYIAKCLNYKKIIFVGIDLTFGKDSYAIKSRKEFFENWISKVHPNKTIHPCKEYLFKFIKYLKNNINFTTYTPSLLEEIIEKHKIIY